MPDTDDSTVRVMIIDDEEFSRKFVTRLLKTIAIEQVHTADSGVDALAQLAEPGTDIDLIICYIEMPEMTGYEFVRQIRYGTVPRFKDVPILILTSYATEKNVQLARTHKINGFVTKPPTADMLRVEIHNALGH